MGRDEWEIARMERLDNWKDDKDTRTGIRKTTEWKKKKVEKA